MVKVLILGWDGASHDHLQKVDTPFFDNLDYSGKLLPEKVYRDIPIDSGTAWTTLTAGVEVEKHGIFSINNLSESENFLKLSKKLANFIPSRRLRTYFFYGVNKLFNTADRTPRSTDVGYKRFWEFTEGKSLILGVPFTYPAWKQRGVMLSGIPAPLEGDYAETFPEGYNSYRKRYRGYYFLDKEGPLEDESQPNLEEYKQKIYEYDEEAFQVVKDIYEEEDFEIVFAIFPIIDDLLHSLDPQEDWSEIEEAYRWLDSRSKELVDELNPENIVIVSDHGMKSVEESLAIGHGDGLKMDHDSRNGIWASNKPLELEEQKDFPREVLKILGKNFEPKKVSIKPLNKNAEETTSDLDF